MSGFVQVPASTVDFGAFDALTFDCYGTLIDWESGILAGLRAVRIAAQRVRVQV